jgi:hypothetical protein
VSTRERRERRAERLNDWADGREEKARTAHQASLDATAGIPFGQPILVGHHSEKRHRAAVERGQRHASAAVGHARKATDMHERAENIERKLERSIYDDDSDAIERLEQRLSVAPWRRPRWARVSAPNAARVTTRDRAGA